MAKLSAEQLKQIWDTSPEELVQVLGDTLRGFGYEVTDEYVQQEMKRLYDGGKPQGGPSLFLAGWIKDGVS